MRLSALFFCTLFALHLLGQNTNDMPYGDVVLPLPIDQAVVERLGWHPNQDYWLTVVFLNHPGGDPVFVETAERLFWLNDMPVVFLGGSGQALPHSILSRGVSWVRLSENGMDVTQVPITLYPRKNRLRITQDHLQVAKALSAALPGVNATYLAQVAHFLAGNLTSLDVQGTSYSVSGYGEVINGSGQWTGESVAANQNLFETVTGDSGATTADTQTDSINVVGSGSVVTSVAGDTLTIAGSGLTAEIDGSTTNELQNLFVTVNSDSGTTTADTHTDTLNVVGSGSVATSVAGDTLTINGSGLTAEVDGSTTNELQNLFATVTGDAGTTSANALLDTLTVAGSGLVSTSVAGDTLTIQGTVADDSLDFAQLSDSLTLDATTNVDMDSNSADLNLDSDTLMIESSTNRVGIGTASPQEQLQIAGGNLLQTPGNPTLAGSLGIGTNPLSVYVSGRYAYVVDADSDDLKVIDVSDPSAPSLTGSLSIGTYPESIYVSGRYAYVVDTGISQDLKVIDISDPSSPSLAGSLVVGLFPISVYVSGRYAYVVDAVSEDLKVIDVSDSSAPSLVGNLLLGSGGSTLRAVFVSGRYAYVVDSGSGELKVIDVSDPSSPSLASSLDLGISSAPISVYISGPYAFVVDTAYDDLKVIDVSDPSAPSLAGSLGIGAFSQSIYVSGRYVYVVDRGSDDLKVIDVSDPSSPSVAGSLGIGTSPVSVYVSGRYAYVVDTDSDDLKVIDVSGAEVTALTAHSLEAGNLQVRNDIIAQGQLQVTSGVSIGSGGLFSDGNIGLSGSLAIANDIAPTSSPQNLVQLYAEDDAGSSELQVRDEAGNVTTLSPHNFSLIGEPSEPMAWSYFSERGTTSINVDMLRAIRILEDISGSKLVYLSDDDSAMQNEGKIAELEKEIKKLKVALESMNP